MGSSLVPRTLTLIDRGKRVRGLLYHPINNKDIHVFYVCCMLFNTNSTGDERGSGTGSLNFCDFFALLKNKNKGI